MVQPKHTAAENVNLVGQTYDYRGGAEHTYLPVEIYNRILVLLQPKHKSGCNWKNEYESYQLILLRKRHSH